MFKKLKDFFYKKTEIKDVLGTVRTEPILGIEEIEEKEELDDEKNSSNSSFLRFNISDDLEVTFEASINSAVLNKMVKENYLTEYDVGDDNIKTLSTIVLANDVVTQILDSVEQMNE